MARTPRYNDGSAVRTSAPNGAPQIQAGNGRGVTIDERSLMGALEVPLLDDSGERAYGAGLAGLGQGLGNLGGAIQQIVEEGQKAKNFTDLSAARTAMAKAKYALNAALENEPDSNKWGDIARDFVSKAPQTWDNDHYAPVVRDQVIALTEQWKAEAEGGTAVAQARKRLGDERDGLIAIRDNSILTGDLPGAQDAIRQLHQRGHIGSEETGYMLNQAAGGVAEAQKKEAHQTQLQNFDNFRAALRLDPEFSLPNDPAQAGITEAQLYTLNNLKQEGQREQRVATGDAVSETILKGVDDGSFTTEAMAVEQARQIPGVTEKQIENAKVLYRKISNQDHRQWVQDNGLVNMSKARQYVQRYRPELDKDRSEYDKLKSWIYASVPPANRADAMALLTAKVKPGSAIPKNDPVLKSITDRLDQMKTGGLLGIYTTGIPLKEQGKDGAMVTVRRNGKTVYEEDPIKLAQIQDKVANIEGHMRQWMIDNPEKAKSQEEATKEMLKYAPKAAVAGAAQAFYQFITGKPLFEEQEAQEEAAQPEPVVDEDERQKAIDEENERQKPKSASDFKKKVKSGVSSVNPNAGPIVEPPLPGTEFGSNQVGGDSMLPPFPGGY